ncbi:hypothetical protein FA95DRAFT_82893 [Auriscalpium vulgare]|uniref:Uncharacterized protein n=1 Tax=Auriscalpium vulgare TaxID=40419 RepID=A0ACB8RQP4_9AGAM|nr:hypothetical protein FA95DRAFT_82893 [Auriscalpium vulgare]
MRKQRTTLPRPRKLTRLSRKHGAVSALPLMYVSPIYPSTDDSSIEHAQELALHSKAIAAWERAVLNVPSRTLTAAETTARDMYVERLARSIELSKRVLPADARVVTPSVVWKQKDDEMPWVRAKNMLPMLTRRGQMDSSAFVIESAASEFNEAVETMFQLTMKVSAEGYRFNGKPGVIQGITNAVLKDDRCFHIAREAWLERFNDQVRMESIHAGIYNINSRLSADGLIAEFRSIHAAGGFDKSRPAIALMTRLLFFNAFLSEGLEAKHAEAVAAYDTVLAVLRWGREEWPNVGKEIRGSVLESTFIRAIRSVRLSTYMEAWTADKISGKFTLDAMLAEAEDILAEIAADSSDYMGDASSKSAFWTYPAGNALSIKGFALYERVRMHGYKDLEEARTLLRKAAEFYFEAAKKFPRDDENHVWYLKIGLDAQWSAGTPMKACLPIVTRIRAAIPEMFKIWEYSSMAQGGREKTLQDVLDFEDFVLAEVALGKASIDDELLPPWCKLDF